MEKPISKDKQVSVCVVVVCLTMFLLQENKREKKTSFTLLFLQNEQHLLSFPQNVYHNNILKVIADVHATCAACPVLAAKSTLSFKSIARTNPGFLSESECST